MAVQIFVYTKKIILGAVSDVSGMLPGLSVTIRDTTQCEETNFDSKYSIRASQGNVLV